MEPYWSGPYRVMHRPTEISYEIEVGPGRIVTLHHDQLKPFHRFKASSGLPLRWTDANLRRNVEVEDPDYLVEKVVRAAWYRGQWWFLVKWRNYPVSANTWEPSTQFVTLDRFNSVVWDFCRKNKFDVTLGELIRHRS